jgi:NADH:ubiquinone oxidoreductase subunit 5 (subunit L)/multisubunit Na+/H+ antiporter MnhA subunit
MVAAIGLGGVLGVDGALFHLLNNILYKNLLFMGIGAVILKVGDEDLARIGGLFKKMPITCITVLVGALSISGFPLFNGFISKSMIFEAAHKNEVISLILEFAAVGTLLSFLKFTYFGFFRPNSEVEKKAEEVPWNMSLALIITAVLCFIIGIYPKIITNILPLPVEANFFTVKELTGIGLLISTTTIVFIVGIRFFEPHTRVTYDFDYFYLLGSRGIAQIAQGFYVANNLLEHGLAKITPALLSLRRPFARINSFFSRFLFSVFVDMWLFRPVTPKVIEEDKVEEAKEKTPFGYLVDLIITQISRIGERISKLADLFDNKVIDGIVNGIGYITVKAGEFLKPLQTGDIQNYGALIVGSSLILILIFIFYMTIGGTI